MGDRRHAPLWRSWNDLRYWAADPIKSVSNTRTPIELLHSYKFGSSDPAAGGMDCSGTVYHVLHAAGITGVPRTSSGQYIWVRKAVEFFGIRMQTVDTHFIPPVAGAFALVGGIVLLLVKPRFA